MSKEVLELALQGLVVGLGVVGIRYAIRYFKFRGKPKGAENIVYNLKKKYHKEFGLTEKTLYVDWVADKQTWVLYKKNQVMNTDDFGKPTMLKTIKHSEINDFI